RSCCCGQLGVQEPVRTRASNPLRTIRHVPPSTQTNTHTDTLLVSLSFKHTHTKTTHTQTTNHTHHTTLTQPHTHTTEHTHGSYTCRGYGPALVRLQWGPGSYLMTQL